MLSQLNHSSSAASSTSFLTLPLVSVFLRLMSGVGSSSSSSEPVTAFLFGVDLELPAVLRLRGVFDSGALSLSLLVRRTNQPAARPQFNAHTYPFFAMALSFLTRDEMPPALGLQSSVLIPTASLS